MFSSWLVIGSIGFIAELIQGGPLVEYERRIAAGELVDGDICQVGSTIKQYIMQFGGGFVIWIFVFQVYLGASLSGKMEILIIRI